MKILLTILFLVTSITSYTQNIYSGQYKYESNIIYNCNNGVVYKGRFNYQSSIVGIFDGKHFYSGQFKYLDNRMDLGW